MTKTDHELMHATQIGDGQAFAELVGRYQRLVRWRISRILPAQQVDDVAQDVFVRLATVLRDPRAQPIQSLGVWLVTIARNLAVTNLRATQQRSHMLVKYQQSLSGLDLHSSLNAAEANTDNDFDSLYAQRLEALAQCVEKLQPKYREILECYYGQGQAAEVIAVQAGRSPGAVRMILMRIRRSLAKCIRKHQRIET